MASAAMGWFILLQQRHRAGDRHGHKLAGLRRGKPPCTALRGGVPILTKAKRENRNTLTSGCRREISSWDTILLLNISPFGLFARVRLQPCLVAATVAASAY